MSETTLCNSIREMGEVFQIGVTSVQFKGRDYQHGKEGIYVENHLSGAIVSQNLD